MWPQPFQRVFTRIQRWRFGSIDQTAPLGKRGEQAAAILLRRKGLKIIAESYSDRAGELDLIALDKRYSDHPTIVFVEVKTLASRKPGHPADRVDEIKQKRVTLAALRYLKKHRLLECRARFDVVAVWWPDQDAPEPLRIEHYEHAFEATGDTQF